MSQNNKRGGCLRYWKWILGGMFACAAVYVDRSPDQVNHCEGAGKACAFDTRDYPARDWRL